MAKQWLVKGLTVVVFILLVFVWLRAAHQKPLWTDELYSQTSSIHNLSYVDMLRGKISEGNITPLFYIIQKAWQNAWHYQTPIYWLQGQWGYQHPPSNTFLRVPPVVCMAAGVALIFYYFASRWGLWLGLYSLLVSFSSFMVWFYAFEARPYALWFFLTSIQMVSLLSLMGVKDKSQDQYVKSLGVVNWLLAFTSIFSVIQNLGVCLVLWLWGRRRWRLHTALFIAPAVISLGYYILTPKYEFFLQESFMGLLGASLPVDRLAIISLGLVLWGLLALKISWFKLKSISPQQWNLWSAALLFTLVIFAGCWALLWQFKAGQAPDKQGFQVSNRYFMVLAPVGIMMTTIASYYLATLPQAVWKRGIWIALGLLLLFRLIKVLPMIHF